MSGRLACGMGFKPNESGRACLPLTIAEVRMQFGKIHGIALIVLRAILFGVLLPSTSDFQAVEKQTKPKSVSNCTEILLPAFYVAAYTYGEVSRVQPSSSNKRRIIWQSREQRDTWISSPRRRR